MHMELRMSEQIYHERSLEVEVYPHLKTALELIDPLLPKVAVDVGCGAGRDALFLVDRGFTVYAFDKSEAAIASLMGRGRSSERLLPQVCSFENYEYPKSSLVNACSSLFFCKPELFSRTWDGISQSLVSGGVFCGHFMGPDDSWAKLGRGDLTIHTRSALEELFGGSYEIIDVCEHNSEGVTLVGRKKHWHTYSVVAQKII